MAVRIKLLPCFGQLEGVTPKGGTLPKEKDSAQIVALSPNDNTVFVPKSEFPGGPYGAGTQENPVNLSDTPTEASHTAMHPEGAEPVDEVAMLGHFNNALSEMAESLMDLEDGYFKALREVIIEMERALQDVSRIDAHYVSQVVTVMASWQEAVHGECQPHHLPRTSRGCMESDERIRGRSDKSP